MYPITRESISDYTAFMSVVTTRVFWSLGGGRWHLVPRWTACVRFGRVCLCDGRKVWLCTPTRMSQSHLVGSTLQVGRSRCAPLYLEVRPVLYEIFFKRKPSVTGKRLETRVQQQQMTLWWRRISPWEELDRNPFHVLPRSIHLVWAFGRGALIVLGSCYTTQ